MNDELVRWFLEHEDDKPDKLAHNKTWNILKTFLKDMGYWKNKARGKPDAKYLTHTTGSKYGITINK